jgi:hypothetical protein
VSNNSATKQPCSPFNYFSFVLFIFIFLATEEVEKKKVLASAVGEHAIFSAQENQLLHLKSSSSSSGSG